MTRFRVGVVAATVLAVVAVVATIVVVSVHASENIASDEEQSAVIADDALPGTTASDWATYGDYVVALTIDDEQATPRIADVSRTDEGLIGRTVTASILAVYWSRPELPCAPPQALALSTLGWHYKNGKRIPISAIGHPRLNVGETYLIAITNFSGDLDAPDWSPLSSYITLAVNGDQIRETEQHNGSVPAEAFAAELISTSTKNLEERLDATPPIPGVNMDLPPVRRLQSAPR